MYRLENEDPWTLWNTVLKMAKKRALADAIERSTNYARRVLNRLTENGFLKLVAFSKNDPNQYFQLIDYND